MDHIDAMDEFRRGIGLRAYGQTDPILAYKKEGYEMFEAMVQSICEDAARNLMTFRLRQPESAGTAGRRKTGRQLGRRQNRRKKTGCQEGRQDRAE